MERQSSNRPTAVIHHHNLMRFESMIPSPHQPEMLGKRVNLTSTILGTLALPECTNSSNSFQSNLDSSLLASQAIPYGKE
ncbi:hypothetical protein NC652_017304 [Populus alba x Populus x berolinensis]|nr:hypothetical protein NC652_017304 [Populus alba x Populus x berolinensis]